MTDEKKGNVVQVKDLRDTFRSRIEELERNVELLLQKINTLSAEVTRLTPKELA